MPLSNRQIRYLRGLTHALSPVVTVADNGLNENVLSEIEVALTHHELIKIKLRGDKPARQDWIRQILLLSKAEQVHVIGQVACFFRRNEVKPVIALPAGTE